jgi:hypothetical protein
MKKPGERHGQEKSTQETPESMDARSKKGTQTHRTRSHQTTSYGGSQ